MGIVSSCDAWREAGTDAEQSAISASPRAPLAVSMLAHEKNIQNRLHRRHIKLYGTHNIRDLGGYKTGRGQSVKWGQVYRGDRLSALAWEEQVTGHPVPGAMWHPEFLPGPGLGCAGLPIATRD